VFAECLEQKLMIDTVEEPLDVEINDPVGAPAALSCLYSTLRLIDDHLSRWAQRKFKHLRQRPKRARTWLAGVVRRTPGLFPHWRLLYANGRMLGAV
jgi:hypothetical protein